jgi:calcium-dependent protein kinase
MNEVKILKDLDNPNIIKMYEYFKDENRLYIVTEICSGGELWQKVKKYIRLTEPQAKEYMKQILRAVNYIHKKNIIHRDIKPENFMIDGTDNTLKMIDFGLSLELEEG